MSTNDYLMISVPATIAVLAIAVYVADYLLKPKSLFLVRVEIIKGKHKGRVGKVTNFPTLLNLWHYRYVSVNVPANEEEIRARFTKGWGERVVELVDNMKQGFGPRHWVKVPRKNVRVLDEQSDDFIRFTNKDFSRASHYPHR